MGIRGLTTFVAVCNLSEHKAKKFQPASAQAQVAKMKIVVDGGALLHHIYFSKKIDFISGGQLDQLEHECTAFFNALLHAGFSPFVIFDGITPDIKSQECVVRQQTTIHSVINHMVNVDSAPNRQILANPVLPTLSQHVLIHVLNQLKVPYSVSDYEADAVAGTHANSNGCAVLSKDSDFYVFSVSQGYIPLDSLSVFQDKLTFDFYRNESLMELLKLKPDMLPAFASLCGNDFVSRESLWGFVLYLRNEYPTSILTAAFPDSRCHDIVRVGKFLSNYNTQQEAFEAAADFANQSLETVRQEREAREKEAKEREAMEKEAREQEAREREAKEKEEREAAAKEEQERLKEEGKEGESTENKPATEEVKAATEEKEKVETPSDNEGEKEDPAVLALSSDLTEAGVEENTKERQNERDKILAMDPTERKETLLSLLNHSATQYVAQNITVGKDTSLALHPLLVPRYNNSSTIPLSLLGQYRQYLFNHKLMGVLCKLKVWLVGIVENTARPKSAWAAGYSIRRVLYGILCGGGAYAPEKDAENKDEEPLSVTEYVRDGDKFVATKVVPSYVLNGKKLPSLPVVMGMPQKTRLQIFLEILSSNIPAVADFESWTFAVAALRAFIVSRTEEKERKLYEWELMAIILAIVNRPPFTQAQSLRHQQSIPRTRDTVHFLAEWRTIIYTAILACNCLFNPIAVPSPSALYDGEVILHYLLKCQNKNLDYRKVMLKKAQDIELFEKIYAAATEGLENKLAKRDNSKINEAEEKKKEILVKLENKRNAVKNKEKASVKQNLFDMLDEDEPSTSPAKVKPAAKKGAAKKK